MRCRWKQAPYQQQLAGTLSYALTRLPQIHGRLLVEVAQLASRFRVLGRNLYSVSRERFCDLYDYEQHSKINRISHSEDIVDNLVHILHFGVKKVEHKHQFV